MLELETRGGQVAGWDGLMEVANLCKKIEIERRDDGNCYTTRSFRWSIAGRVGWRMTKPG
jgi:hypothetical protein